MLSGLMLTAFLMGVSGAPHCAAMCGTACAAAFRHGLPVRALVGRCIGYALLGALAAASAGLIASWGREVAFLKPIWLIAQVLVVGFGLLMLVTGRVPSQLDQWGLAAYHSIKSRLTPKDASKNTTADTWLGFMGPVVAGLAWAVLPCGLLYGALMVAALASDAMGGMLVMLSFALPSAVGVWAAPQLLKRLSQFRWGASAPVAKPLPSPLQVAPILWVDREQSLKPSGLSIDGADRWLNPALPIRVSGLMLAVMAGGGLAHHIWAQWQAWCG